MLQVIIIPNGMIDGADISYCSSIHVKLSKGLLY